MKIYYFITNYSGETLTTNDVKCDVTPDIDGPCATICVLSENEEELDICTGYPSLEDLQKAINPK